MVLFLLTFFLIYGGLHLYIYLRALDVVRLPAWGAVLVALFFVAMIVSPIAVRFLERNGHDSAARLTACTGYSWLGFVFFFFCILLCFDIARLVTYAAGVISKNDVSWFMSLYRPFFYVGLIASVLLCLYGYREAIQIRPHVLRIETEKLPKGTDKFTITQISDVHLGLIVREEKIKKIVEIIKSVDPHILVSTGDLVDSDIDDLEKIAYLFKSVNPPYGKYAITGNHEFYAGIKSAIRLHKQAGFQMLRNESISASPINIAGVDDPAGGPTTVSEKALLSSAADGLFTILLKHRPVLDKEAAGMFDLQLSGHTHKGQIYPFRYLTRLAFPLYTGYYRLSQKSHLYVSRGTGTWGPPIRFLAPPEVTVIELVRAERAAHVAEGVVRGAER